jgi:hypothetical protein
VFTPRIRRSLMLAALVFFAAKPAPAVNISDTGVGEALIFPYFLANGSASTLLSITNRTDKPKALKVRVREGMNGASVFSFNLFLQASDVWTGALAAAGTVEAAGIITVDASCTTPKISSAALSAFSTRNFNSDSPSLRTADRTREGYIEVFEMATIEPTSLTGKDVSFSGEEYPARRAGCNLVSDQAIAANRADFLPPSGGLTGSATIVSNSMSTGYDAIALQSLGIRTGATNAESTSPDWTDVTNTTAMLIDGSDATNPRMIAARFDRGVDAVSALFMASALSGEYAFTKVFGADWIVTMPTKRLYVNDGASLGPFDAPWNGASGAGVAQTEVFPSSFTRDAMVPSEDCGVSAPLDPITASWSTGVFKFRESNNDVATASALPSRNSRVWLQNGCWSARPAAQDPRIEGGWGFLEFTGPRANSRRLVSRSDSIVISSSGSQTIGPLTFSGLPAIGIAVSAAVFPGAQSENFNSSYWLKATRLVR